MTRAALAAAAIVAALSVSRASAQEPPRGRVEAGAGVTWMGSASAGSAEAAETTPSGGISPIFRTAGTLTGAAGLRAHAAVRLTRAIEAEAVASYTKPTLEVSVSNDIENAAPVVARETVTQYVVGGGALWYVPLRRMSGRLRPFVAGHAAYLRQLHESATLAATGQSYQIGGGVKYFVPVQRRSLVKGVGIRGDAGVAARRKGVLFDERVRFAPIVAASAFVRF
jgi:hypothetical protein